MPNNKHYLRRVVPQHRKPKFLKWLDTNITPFYEAETLLKAMDGHFDLSQSVGVQMNVTGDIVGRERVLSFDPMDGSSPILDDTTYRLLQRAKISLNMWDGTIPGIMGLWDNLFPEYKLFIQDNQDMTMDLYVVGLVTPLEMELLARGYIAPKPMGVLIRFTFIYEHDPMEHTAYIAGVRHNSITYNEMPVFVPDFNFGQLITMAGHTQRYSISEIPIVTFEYLFEHEPKAAGSVHGGINVSRLPPHEFDYHFELMQPIGGGFWGFSVTEIPPYYSEGEFNLIGNISGAGWNMTQTTLPKGG